MLVQYAPKNSTLEINLTKMKTAIETISSCHDPFTGYDGIPLDYKIRFQTTQACWLEWSVPLSHWSRQVQSMKVGLALPEIGNDNERTLIAFLNSGNLFARLPFTLLRSGHACQIRCARKKGSLLASIEGDYRPEPRETIIFAALLFLPGFADEGTLTLLDKGSVAELFRSR
jgi:hypothetical protein